MQACRRPRKDFEKLYNHLLGPDRKMTRAEALRMTENEIGTIVVDAAIAVLMKDGITRCVNGLEE